MTLALASPATAPGAPSGSSEALAIDYLAGLRALAAEMQTAMDAIARNSLPDLERSLGRQEELTVRLRGLARKLGPDMPIDRPAGLSQSLRTAGGSVGHRIRRANGVLGDLNQRYAALIKHSGKSIELLASLCANYTEQSYAGPMKEARGAGSKHQTWDCEM